MNKKAIAILGAIFMLIVLTLAFLIFQKRKTAQPETDPIAQEETETQTPEEQQPPEVANKAIKLTDDQVVSPVLFFKGDGVTYFTRQGELYRNKLTVSGDTVLLSNREALPVPIKAGINKVIWPQASDNFIAELGDPAKPLFAVYVNDKGGYVDMPAKVTAMDWIPSGQQLVYLWLDKGKTTLNIANADSTNYTVLTEMWENDNKIHVSPDGTKILYYRTGNTEAANNINAVTIDGKTFKAIVKDGYNMGVLWAPDSQQFLFGKKDVITGRTGLWLGNVVTGAVKNLDLATSPDKAVWTADGTTIVVAVPKQPTGVAGSGQDMFYKVSASSLIKESFDPKVSVDARELFLSLENDRVYFRNMLNGGLYYLNLK